jgi:Concanavalin A-like lectin/glucanases superfamily
MGQSFYASGGLQLQAAGLNYADFNGNGFGSSGFDANFTVDWTNFEVNSWCQIVVTRSATDCSMFVNGLKVGSQIGLTPFSVPQPPIPWSFGANVLAGSLGTYSGFSPISLNRIHTYNRALSDSEVVSLYANEASGIVPTATIVVKTNRVNLNQLVLGQTYQLQSSPDFLNWTNLGGSFSATNSSTFQDVDILGTGMGYFRVVEEP